MELDDYLREQAATYRELAENTRDPDTQREFIELATACEEVADNIEDRRTGG